MKSIHAGHRGIIAAALACAVALLLVGCSGHTTRPSEPAPSTQVMTAKGAVHGVEAGKVIKFLGIPYAAPPVGNLRFRPPQPHAPWQGVLQATTPKPVCPQNPPAPGLKGQTHTEDCLYLNVWRPSSAGNNLPVFVFVPGGAFVLGGGSPTNPSALVSQAHEIVVTFNYRLGALGFLASAALEAHPGDSGNYGTEDVTAVLQWVHRNIAAFGGNPGNVTLGGESAGSILTCLATVAPAARGTFQRIIAQSGPCATHWPRLSHHQYRLGSKVVSLLHCNHGSVKAVAACLRSPKLTAEDFLAAQAKIARMARKKGPPKAGSVYVGTQWGPSVDGTVVAAQPRTAVGDMPALMGFVKYELVPYAFYSFQGAIGKGKPNPTNQQQYIAALKPVFGSHAKAVAEVYPLHAFASGNLALNTIIADAPGPLGICGDIRTFNIAAKRGRAPLYAYNFDDPNAPPVLGGKGGPVHVSNVQYVFRTHPLPGDSQKLSQTMIAYWGNFIRSGNPNGDGLPHWPAYHRPTDVLRLVPNAVHTGVNVAKTHHCAFWNRRSSR